MTDPPKKRRGPRRPKPDILPATVPDEPTLRPTDDREAVANFWRARMDQIQAEHEERVKILRTAGEHPSPVFAKMVKESGALGLGKSVTAKLLGIAPHTLETYYGEDYEIGTAQVISAVAANAIRIGTSLTDPNNAKVALAILDRRGGQEWRPPAQKLEVADDRDKPKNIINSSDLTAEQRAQLRQMIEYAKGGNGVAGPGPADEDDVVSECADLVRTEKEVSG